jgi:hypothetical protein
MVFHCGGTGQKARLLRRRAGILARVQHRTHVDNNGDAGSTISGSISDDHARGLDIRNGRDTKSFSGTSHASSRHDRGGVCVTTHWRNGAVSR